jgi:hypothetical protein
MRDLSHIPLVTKDTLIWYSHLCKHCLITNTEHSLESLMDFMALDLCNPSTTELSFAHARHLLLCVEMESKRLVKNVIWDIFLTQIGKQTDAEEPAPCQFVVMVSPIVERSVMMVNSTATLLLLDVPMIVLCSRSLPTLTSLHHGPTTTPANGLTNPLNGPCALLIEMEQCNHQLTSIPPGKAF